MSSQPWTRPLSGRGLRVVGILLPIAGVVLLELARHVFEARGYSSARLMEAWHVAMLVLVVGAIVGFGLFMFRLIDASERQILTQNRDLTTANAVAAAMQGQSTVSGVIDGALDAVVRTAGATRARILLSDPDGASGRDEATYTSVAPGAMRDAGGPSLDVPLAHGGTPVGRLSVWYAEEPAVRERLGSTVLSSLTTQIACAIQLARAVEDLNRRKREGHALYDILLRVSNQDPLTPVLDAVAQHARTRLGAAGASITINPATASSVRFESGPQGPALLRDGTVVITSGTAQEQHAAHAASELVTGAAGPLGGIRVVRASGTFSDRDRGFLSTLASLVGIALTGAQLREASRQRAILDERTRIAREMHDGLAQVLGAAHLRLRALSASLATLPEDEVAAEIDALAEVCAESYGDVREAILGLRDADRHAKRSLEDNLRAYLSTYSAQAGIASTLLNEVGHEVSLSPRAEVHLIRVVQEALTNVRKHASATSVTVSISGTHSTTSFVIADDGVGFDPAATEGSQDGYGLFTMRDRAALLGGTVEIDSVIGRGTRVTVTVPERSIARTLVGSDR